MFAFGVAVSNREIYERVALPSIHRAAEPDSLVLTRHGHDSIQEPYNELLDEAASHEDLEALILVHQDLELRDDSLLGRVRPLLADSRNAVIGLFGARRIASPYWSETSERFGREMSPTSTAHHSTGSYEVEVVDGSLLVLAPWVVRAVRFGEPLVADFHGYDVDFCLRVRASGGRVICSDVPYFHHMTRPWADARGLRRALRMLARMWDPSLRPPEWAPAFRGPGPARTVGG